ncbi:tetratricopeptide repeat protein [Dyadobacter sp. LJ53]|uniref:tetratricopeptide repeat protein n=1 Tax=Dyadobacter chenwenxiniae TaxID=2906456 RepID=UPI001F1F7F03|nr:tetratricopeptide repeat protein [Dyadobacter chenwenxiniae]MCF0051494.1 tetratricopeptide repeat protein [Dyadobacter chenwenxiniae]
MNWKNNWYIPAPAFLKRVILFLLLAITFSVHGDDLQYDVIFTPKLQKAYFDIQKLRLPYARTLIDAERSAEKTNAFIPYLDNYADLHYLLISEDKKAYKELSQLENPRLQAIGNLPDNSPYKRFLQAEIRMHWAFAKLKFGNEVSGSWEIIKAYKLLEENKKRFPDFLPTLKSLGLLHVLIGSIPENYGWVAKILGLKGNIQNGIDELRIVEKEVPFFRQEAELIDLLLHAYTLQLSPTQQSRLRQWPKQQPDNLLIHFFATTVLMKEGRSDEAAHYLAEAPSGESYISFPFLEYLKGEINLQKGNYEEAADHYALFLKKYNGFNYIKDSNLKLFMCHWLNDEDQQANVFIKKIKTTGSAIIEADQLAERIAAEFLSGKISPAQKILYKARYATDGGYLKAASALMDAVTETSFASTEEKAEFNYRKGRILQKSGQPARSIPYYNRALTLSKLEAAGFGAASALQLGYISLEKNDRPGAIAYFERAMSFKKHEYKNSIDNKARAALTSLGQ